MVKRLIGVLAVTLVLAQGLQLLHGIDHVLPVNDGDCIVCLKVDKLKHGLTVDAAPRALPVTPAYGIVATVCLSPRPAGHCRQPRAPPHPA